MHVDPTLAEAWLVLGIEPTVHANEIRRAYAAALKKLDIDADPAGFLALRLAFETARASLSGDRPDDHHRDAGERRTPAYGPEPEDGEIIGQTMTAIIDLLHDDDPHRATQERLVALTTQLVESLRSAGVEREIEGEEWLATVIAAHRPRSDAMIRPAVAAFHWAERSPSQFRPHKTSVVLDRLRELDFGERVLLLDTGRHHLAWRTLQHPPTRGLFRRPDLAELAAVRSFLDEVGGDTSAIAGVTFDRVVVVQWREAVQRHGLAIDRWKASRRTGWTRKVALSGRLLIAGAFAAFIIALMLL